MIQFNLLPAVKLDYVKARRNKRLTILGASLVAGTSLLVLILLFASVQLQSKHSGDLTKDIKSEGKKLTETTDISRILTIQNQLNSLSDLHASKPETGRLFDYLKQVTPIGVTISSAVTDFEANTISLSGDATAISTVNIYTDTLKFTTYKTADNKTANAFSQVVLKTIGAPADNNGKVAFTIEFKYDPIIFSNTSDVSLVVPSQVTTRSQIDKPNALFNPQGAQ